MFFLEGMKTIHQSHLKEVSRAATLREEEYSQRHVEDGPRSQLVI